MFVKTGPPATWRPAEVDDCLILRQRESRQWCYFHRADEPDVLTRIPSDTAVLVEMRNGKTASAVIMEIDGTGDIYGLTFCSDPREVIQFDTLSAFTAIKIVQLGSALPYMDCA